MASINAILLDAKERAEAWEGKGPKPKIVLDMEHLQVADYAAFQPMTKQQQQAIRKLQATEPIRTEEMAYLALRSLITPIWDMPQSEADLRYAAAYDVALERILTEVSLTVAKTLVQPEALLPYWGRLGFLRVMASIPEDQIQAERLDRFAAVLLKKPAFNAHSFQHENFGLIGLNFALEPMLKSLNHMLLHFFHTSEMKGPRRLDRAWNSLVPVVAYFWSRETVAANRLSRRHLLFEQDVAQQGHSLTASQIDFIIRHEMGHLLMNHASQLRSISSGAEAATLRFEFEFAADAFAQSGMRSALYSRLRKDLQWSQEAANVAESGRNGLEALHEHQSEVSAVRLLFLYMDVIDQSGQFLNKRLGNGLPFRERLDSHPTARSRISRLDTFHIGEHVPTSKLLRYAEDFFAAILGYARDLDDATLFESVRDLYRA
ncbi:MAG: hypothetical protein ING69_07985 [Rhodocyclaceae bacterium]|nr:hypothetical protein [Rhodocyclaceae bacterium]MCA3082582.1 hypothetical protein [Rhodocyclaceae bacterium]